MLHERGDDVWTGVRRRDGGADDAEDGVVVGLGAAAGEENLLGPGAEEGRDLFAGGLDGGAGLLTEGVDGGGVAEFAGKIGKHGVEHFWLDGGGGVVIEVDAVQE